MGRVNWERTAAILVCLFLGGAALFLSAKFLLPILLPFLISWALSLIIRPLARRLSSRTSLSEGVWSVVLLTSLLLGLSLLVGFSLSRLLREVGHLLGRLLEQNGGVEGAIRLSIDYLESLASQVSWLRPAELGEDRLAFRAHLVDMISEVLGNILSSIGSRIPEVAARIVSSFPSILLVTLITVVAGFYFCMDGERIMGYVTGLLPGSFRGKLPLWRAKAGRVFWRYLRAYLLLFVLTVGELFLGLTVLRVEYAFLLSLLIAVVDVLPILGVGTVLVPWAVVAILQKNFYVGFGLLILYAAMTVLRQILEPKLVGSSLGLHPLLTLFAGYAGFRLFGILGMLLGPVAALLIKAVVGQIRDAVGEDARGR